MLRSHAEISLVRPVGRVAKAAAVAAPAVAPEVARAADQAVKAVAVEWAEAAGQADHGPRP